MCTNIKTHIFLFSLPADISDTSARLRVNGGDWQSEREVRKNHSCIVAARHGNGRLTGLWPWAERRKWHSTNERQKGQPLTVCVFLQCLCRGKIIPQYFSPFWCGALVTLVENLFWISPRWRRLKVKGKFCCRFKLAARKAELRFSFQPHFSSCSAWSVFSKDTRYFAAAVLQRRDSEEGTNGCQTCEAIPNNYYSWTAGIIQHMYC